MEGSLNLSQPLPRIPSPDQVTAITNQNIEAFLQLIAELSNTVISTSATFANTIQRLAHLENSQSGDEAIIAALQYAGSDEATLVSVQAASKAWSRAQGDEDVQSTLYQLFNAVKLKGEPLDPEDQRLLDRTLRDLTQQGAAVSNAADRASWQETQQEIESLCVDFNRNIRECDCIVLATDAELDGLPAADIKRYPQPSAGCREVHIRTKYAIAKLLQCIKDADVRRRIEAEYAGTLSQNAAIFRQVLIFRDKNAHLLGLTSHAAYRLSARLPKAMSSVYNLLETLGDKLLPLGRQYIHDLEQQRRKHLSGPGTSISVNINKSVCKAGTFYTIVKCWMKRWI